MQSKFSDVTKEKRGVLVFIIVISFYDSEPTWKETDVGGRSSVIFLAMGNI